MKSRFEYMINMLKRYNFRNLNIRLIIYVLVLTILGINVISSATDSSVYEAKQVLGFIIGLVIMVALTLISYNFLLRYYWIIYGLNLAMLLSVLIFGESAKGAQRWIDFGFFQIQPSEFSKILIVLFVAQFIVKHKDKINDIKFLATLLILYLIPLALIFKQPNLSTSIVFFILFCVIMFIAGLSYKIIGVIFAVTIPIAIILGILVMQPNQSILAPHQYDRLVGFFEKDNEIAARIRYQQENSVMAIGSGGLFGKGLNNNTITSVKNANFISEPQTDFIYTIIGEELGFVGAAAVIILLALITFECFRAGSRAPNLAGRLICCGFGAQIGFQAIINLAVATMLIPNTGLTLPFVSYGLSSLTSAFAGVGLVLNIDLQRRLTY
ncbi:FtsW/RodA/SpoVE family cell cycle protein [Parasporobacterium paucivorans]|uniref:Rod shape determining protein RodA n=1 Tax=Parasporobacterium paucivorans DSM 15970 TaxID=1122934 RepID=A0A1M6A390_9FIRM|nr:FtsW/RodA/SpoVE family cell cycle protein [Parasporobacterium paucivorans]SHI30888.1 rod shape determining protein RodA [Parasporobacterium paucivorans DSM 15970]